MRPSKVEKDALKCFMQRNYPVLWENSPNTIEYSINSRLDNHSKLISMVKEASSLRRKRNKN